MNSLYFIIDEKYKEIEDELMPRRSTPGSAGYDFKAAERTVVKPKQVTFVETGVAIHMPQNFWVSMRSRSSLSSKHGLLMANGVGVIDSDYFPHTVKMPFYNTTYEDYVIEQGERIGQFIFEKYYTIEDDEPLFKRRTGGFGSTGK